MALDWSQINPFREKPISQNQPKPEPKVEDNSNDPNKKIDSKNQQQGDDPLLQFDSLWQPNKDKDGKVIEDTPTNNGAYLPPIDNKKLGELVGRMDFTRSLDPALLQAVSKGGEEGTAAMMKIINSVGQQSFTASFQAATRLAEQGFVSAKDRFMADVPNHIRDQFVDTGLAESMELMNDPAFAPVVKSVKDQYLRKFPKASSTDVSKAVAQYFEKMKEKLTKKEENQDSIPDNQRKLRQGAPDADFSTWLGEDLNTLFAPSGQDTVAGS